MEKYVSLVLFLFLEPSFWRLPVLFSFENLSTLWVCASYFPLSWTRVQNILKTYRPFINLINFRFFQVNAIRDFDRKHIVKQIKYG